MSITEAPVMVDQERIAGLASSLKTLANYLLLAKEDAEKEFTFLWDWEMIFEAVYPFASSSIYSGILWYGLECLHLSEHTDDVSWRIVIPEGSRDELRVHLERVRTKYQTILDRPEVQSLQPQDVDALANDPAYDRPDYKIVNRDLAQLRTLDLAMARLLHLLRTYARPLPYTLEQVPQTAISYYKERLGTLRKDADDIERNNADALNLASTELLGPLSATDQKRQAALITATKAVAKRAPSLARDPIFFGLTAILRKNFPNRRQREQVIMNMIGSLYRIITNLRRMAPPGDDEDYSLTQLREESEAVVAVGETPEIDALIEELSLERPERLRSGALTSRYELRTFTEAIDTLRSDPTLVLLSTLMSQASQAARSAHFQSVSIAKDLEVLRGGSRGGADGIISQILASLEVPRKPDDDAFEWERLAVDSAVMKYTLVDKSKRPVLEAEKLETGIAVQWSTYDALDEFCDAAKGLAREVNHEETVGVLVRLYHQVGVKTDEVAHVGDLQQSLRKMTDNEKLSLLRLDFGDARLWFRPGDMFTAVEDADAVLQPTRIAFHAYRHDSLTAFGSFVSATSSYAFNRPQATKLLHQLWDLKHVSHERRSTADNV